MITPTLLLAAALAQPGADAAPLDWKTEEAALLSDHVQLTFPDRFVKAGEAYFDHNSPPQWVIFQAVPVPEEGEEPSPHYSMYVAKLIHEGERIAGLEEPILISPEGTANTCGWFHPIETGRVLFGSTLVPPSADEKSGFQVGTRKYTWQFPVEMEVATMVVGPMYLDARNPNPDRSKPPVTGVDIPRDFNLLKPVFSRPMYDAECSWSPDGRFVLYAHIREPEAGEDGEQIEQGPPDADLWIYDTTTDKHRPLVTADGYDGGPFFSPDGTWICYRSDRRGDNELQLFIAELAFGEDGACTGITREVQLTENSHVNWAPYWHPSSRDGRGVLVYATSEVGHHNYEVFAIEADPDNPAEELRTKRVTAADGFDGLPVFSADGQWMMWTSQRGEKLESEQRPSSQVWIARVKEGMFESADALFAAEGAGEAGGAGEVLAE